MRKEILPIKNIVIDEKLFPREKVNNILVGKYSKLMSKGTTFPDLFIGLFKGKYHLIDGRHRYEAYKVQGVEYVSCEVKINFPTFDDMFLASFRANEKHGLPFTVGDRRKVAYTLVEMKYEVESIVKLTGLDHKTLERDIVKKATKQSVAARVKSKDLPDKITFHADKKDIGTGSLSVVDDAGIVSDNQIETNYQVNQLEEIKEYLEKTKFIKSEKKVADLLFEIKKLKLWRNIK